MAWGGDGSRATRIPAKTCAACGAATTEHVRDGCSCGCKGYERRRYECGRVATWHNGTFSATGCPAAFAALTSQKVCP